LGYVRRSPDESDRRNVLIETTAKGVDYLRVFAAIVSTAGQVGSTR